MNKPRPTYLVLLLITFALILFSATAVLDSSLPQAKVNPSDPIQVGKAEEAFAPVTLGSEPGLSDHVLRELPKLRVKVVDESLSPLEHCEVRVASDEYWQSGASDDRGEAFFGVPSDSTSSLLIQVTASGYQDEFLTIPPGRMSVTVPLRAGGRTVHGRIVTVDGGVPPEQLQAVAWPRGIVAPAALLQRGGGIRALAGHDGSFVLKGLPATALFLVGASGRGWVSRRPILVESGDNQKPVLVTACKIFGVVAQARDAAGRHFEPSSFANIAYSAVDQGFHSLHGSQKTDWALAGLLDAIRQNDPGDRWYDALLAFKAERLMPSVRVSLRYSVPGVKDASAIVMAYPVNEDIGASVIYLESGGEVADIVVDFEPHWGDRETRLRGRPLFELQICDDGGEPKWRHYFNYMHRMTLRGVPCGFHRIRVVRSVTGQSWSARQGTRVEVQRGGQNLFTFDTSELCAARIVGPDELWSQEARSINVGRMTYEFDSGPYIVWGLSPGQLKVKSGDCEGLAELVAGATATVHMKKVTK